MNNHSLANMNAVTFWSAKGGTAYYESDYEPWGDTGYNDPGYDPLEIAIEEAHNNGLELHAWFNVFQTSSTKLKVLQQKNTPNGYAEIKMASQ